MKYYLHTILIIALLCTIQSFVYGTPISQLDSNNNHVDVNSEIADIENEYLRPSDSHSLVKKSLSEPCLLNSQDQNGGMKCSEDEDKNTKPEESLTASTKDNSRERAQISGNTQQLPYNRGLTIENPQFMPFDTNSWTRSPYKFDSSANPRTMGIGIGNYGGVLYPYVHPRMFASFNPMPPVNSLPPVHSTYIHGMNSPEDILQMANEENLFNPSNAVYMPMNMRMVRTPPSRHDDFMAELAHDAMMNNILPTMSIPLLNGGHSQMRVPYSPPGVSPSSNQGPVIAVYPQGASSCAQPVLLSCSPKVSHGIVGQKMYPIRPTHMSPAEHGAYRQQQPEQDKQDNKLSNRQLNNTKKPLTLKPSEMKSLPHHN